MSGYPWLAAWCCWGCDWAAQEEVRQEERQRAGSCFSCKATAAPAVTAAHGLPSGGVVVAVVYTTPACTRSCLSLLCWWRRGSGGSRSSRSCLVGGCMVRLLLLTHYALLVYTHMCVRVRIHMYICVYKVLHYVSHTWVPHRLFTNSNF